MKSMKELSIEEKAKRYESALERCRKLYNEAKANEYTSDIEDYETIFPELKEDDDRIRKAQKAEEMKTAKRCRNCKHCQDVGQGWYSSYQCMARTWGKKRIIHYSVSLSQKACELFERKTD